MLDRMQGRKPRSEPEWINQPVRNRVAISTPAMLAWFRYWNALDPKKLDGSQKPYREPVKPFGFLEHAPFALFMQQPQVTGGASGFKLIAPKGERQWSINLHVPDGTRFRLTTSSPLSGDPYVVEGPVYGDLIATHPTHPERKFLGPDGLPCHCAISGLLRRRSVIATDVVRVGKEAHALERIEAGLVDDFEELLTVYERDPREQLRELLRGMSVKAAVLATGFIQRQAFYLRSGKGNEVPKLIALVTVPPH